VEAAGSIPPTQPAASATSSHSLTVPMARRAIRLRLLSTATTFAARRRRSAGRAMRGSRVFAGSVHAETVAHDGARRRRGTYSESTTSWVFGRTHR
jgi:hypothetical protein